MDAIAAWMRDLWWERGPSGRAFAAAWSLSESTVHNYSAEAHRLVMREVDAEEAGRETGLALRRVLHDAVRDNDRHTVLRASEIWATISGAKAAEKYEDVTPEHVTPAKARRVMRELFGDVTPGDAERSSEAHEGEPPEGPSAE